MFRHCERAAKVPARCPNPEVQKALSSHSSLLSSHSSLLSSHSSLLFTHSSPSACNLSNNSLYASLSSGNSTASPVAPL